MRGIKHIFYFLLGGLFLLSSCSVEKRRYLSGYYFHHHTNYAKKTKSQSSESVLAEVKQKKETSKQKEKELNENIIASKKFSPKYIPVTIMAPGDTCDTLILRNGVEIKAHVLEITPDLIRYKHCDNPNGPTYNMSINNVAGIIYKNGTKDEFKIEHIESGPGGSSGGSSSSTVSDREKVIKKGNATLMWGILAFPLLIIYFFGIVCAIVAIENAVSLKRWIKREPYLYDEKAVRKANIGMILGIILLSLILLIIIVAIAIASGGSLFGI